VRSQSFFDNEPKQILSAIPDLSAKNKQTVASSIRGTATTTKQPLLLLLRFQIIQSTLPYLDLLCAPAVYGTITTCNAATLAVFLQIKITPPQNCGKMMK